MLISDTISRIEHALKGLPHFRRLPAPTKRRLAVDTTLVGLSLRTGCLIDLFSPQEPVIAFSSLITALREDPTTRELGVKIAHVYEPESDQSFIANVEGLVTRVDLLLDGDSQKSFKTVVSCVALSPPNGFEYLEKIPTDILGAASFLREAILHGKHRPSFSLPPGMPINVTVPLAAIFLDYAVAYRPGATSPSSSLIFLNDVPVATYECFLSFQGPGRQQQRISIMKFSCPVALEELIPERFSSQKLTLQVEEELTRRLAQIGDPSAVLTVLHETVVQERLAL